MYACAQHVKRPAAPNESASEGINSFVYKQRDDSAAPRFKQLDVSPPSNNSVESWLEIDIVDGAPRGQVEALLLALHAASSQGQTKTTVDMPSVGRAEFGYSERYRSTREQEWYLLKSRLLAMPLDLS